MPRTSRITLWAIFTSSCFLPATHALTGDSWCGTLMCVEAIVNGSTVTYELKALNQLGWMSIGFGPHMSSSPLVIMWPNDDGSVSLSQRLATGHVPPQLDSAPPRIASVSSANTNLLSATSPTLAFDIPKNDDTVQSLVWAFGVTRPPPDKNAAIVQHLDAGSFSLDLRKGSSGEGEDEDGDDGPASTQGPTSLSSSAASSSATPNSSPNPTSSSSLQLSSSPSPSSLSSASALPLTQPSPSNGSNTPTLRVVLAAHAALSFLGFCVVLPLAALVARWCRTITSNWFRVFWWIIAFLFVPIGTAGWALGPVVVAIRGRRHVVNEHQIGGVILFALCTVQIASGVTIHLRQPKHGRMHPIRNIVHVAVGLLILGCSFFEAKTGITRDGTLSSTTEGALTIACVIWAIVVALAYLAGLVRLRRQFDQERLGWHLSLASGVPAPRTGLFANQQEAHRTAAIGRRAGNHLPDDGTHDAFSQTSSGGPVAQQGDDATPAVEMRELQSPVPVSVRM